MAEPAEAGSRERSLRLEELARQKTESVTAAPQARLGLTAAHDTAAGVASEVSCSAEARSRGDTWFACIEALREAGLHAIADEEFEALRAAFPEFVPPVTNDR